MTDWLSIAIQMAAKIEDCCGCNWAGYLSEEEEAAFVKARQEFYADGIESPS